MKWVALAWAQIADKPEMVVDSFLIAGITQPLDGSEDGGIMNADDQDQINVLPC